MGFLAESRTLLRAATFAICGAISGAVPDAAEAGTDRFSVTTGGILRFPNSLQPKDGGNGFGEGWVKLSYRLGRVGNGDLSAFVLGNLVADTTGFAYNNTAKVGLGVAYSIQPIPELNITFSARYDVFRERGTETRQSGMRYAIDWYYYRFWEPEGEKLLGRLSSKGTHLKSYGNIATPGSLDAGDTNIVVTFGGELSRDYALPSGNWLLTPFADWDISWDKDRNDYNNKLVPGLGVKLRRPLDGGEVFLGARIGADYRWVSGTMESGAALFAGWYKAF